MRLGLFSISYAGLWGQHRLDLPAFISKAGDLGYGTVMLAGKRPHLSPLDTTRECLSQTAEALRKAGIGCDVIAGYTDFSGAGAAEVPVLEMQIAYVEALAGIASQLGAEVVRIFTSYEGEAGSYPLIWHRTVTGIQECCDRAADHGVMIAVQNHHDIGVHTDSLLELLNDIDRPNCKLGFDAWSPALRGEDLYEAARRMAPHTAITTCADYVRLRRFQYRPELVNYEATFPDAVRAVPFGDGTIDYKAFFRGLKEGGFDGTAIYEMCSPLRGGGSERNLDRCAERFLEWMNAM